MNISQLVQDVIDGKESAAHAAELILNEIGSLKAAFSQIADPAIKELQHGVVSDGPGELAIREDSDLTDLFIKAIDSNAGYREPTKIRVDFKHPKFNNKGFAELQLNKSDELLFLPLLKYAAYRRKYELFLPTR